MRRRRTILALSAALLLIGALLPAGDAPPARAARTDVRYLAAAPSTLDPAAQSDIDSAAISAQLFETLTAFDTGLVLRPALAAGWDISTDARRVVFHLRPNLAFSDGSPLTAADVVRSWFRVIDPAAPSPLASLALGIAGAAGYRSGTVTDRAQVGLRASGSDVIVDLVRPTSDFPSIVASPTFAVVPNVDCPAAERTLDVCPVSSGAYLVTAATDDELTLAANDRYWAGKPVIQTVHLITDIGGRSPVTAFEDDDLDYAPIALNDASWIRFDETLGPQLRLVPSLEVTYLAFDTTRPPFDDVRVRQAFGSAVDWQRVVTLGGFAGILPADSLVPPGIPGGGDRSWMPVYDPALARRLLAEAGFPGGAGFPDVIFGSPEGSGFGTGIAAAIHDGLGITIRREWYDDFFARVKGDAPSFFTFGWIADYPGPNDFLGILLGSGASANYGRWSSAEFDAAIEDALGTTEPAAITGAYERALAVVQRDVPAIPLAYGDSFSLSRTGLLGAGQNGLGIPRFASLAWAP